MEFCLVIYCFYQVYFTELLLDPQGCNFFLLSSAHLKGMTDLFGMKQTSFLITADMLLDCLVSELLKSTQTFLDRSFFVMKTIPSSQDWRKMWVTSEHLWMGCFAQRIMALCFL